MAILATADRQLGAIYDGLPANAMLVVYTCQGDTAECRRLQVKLRGWLWGVRSLQAHQCQGCLSAVVTCLCVHLAGERRRLPQAAGETEMAGFHQCACCPAASTWLSRWFVGAVVVIVCETACASC